PPFHMRTDTLVLFAGLALLGNATAQRLATYSTAGAGFGEHQPPTAVLPAALPPVAGYPTVPVMPVVPPAPPFFMPNGDSTFNNMTGVHWVTNGLVMAQQPTPTFPPLAPILPPFPIPPAVLAAIAGGPVTGIAINPVLGVMYLCGQAGPIVGVAPVPGMPILVPPFPIPFPTGPITGLEWDGITGTLWAVDAPGVCFNFLPGGAPGAPPIAPAIALVAPTGDVAIDKTGSLNPFGLRSLYVAAGPVLVDVNTPAPVFFPSGPPLPNGLAFIDHPASVPPVGTCLCPGTGFPTQATSSVMSSGNGAFALSNGGFPPGWPVVFIFDGVFSPVFIPFPPSGCPLGLVPGSPSMITFLVVANPAGIATLPIPLFYPVGTGPLYNQNLSLCPTDPTGFILSPLRVIEVGGF
ncbi:MAG TPA: hypothetical protein VF384_01015, partial [Planctomycetota bacterium]